MSHKLISRNDDLKELVTYGFEVEVKDNHLLVHHIPYVNSEKEIKYGILVSTLNLTGTRIEKPDSHVIYFIGEHPCNKEGKIISQISHSSSVQNLSQNITVDHSFSNKPSGGYNSYYEKFTRYVEIISAPAKSIDDSVSEKTFLVRNSSNENSIFKYYDTNSTRAEIFHISSKLEKQTVAIIGLGGTGSYILDFIAKTSVEEIHLYDGDSFLQHNAFRAPGAASLDELYEKKSKVEYFSDMYSNMRNGIITHNYFLDLDNVDDSINAGFVFICIDNNVSKKIIIDSLLKKKIPFIDVGMGVNISDDKLGGILRTTLCTKNKNDHRNSRIPFSDNSNNDYSKNIQLAELNALNATLAVIKWKKLFSFYHDDIKEYNTTYSISSNLLVGDDSDT